MIDEIEISGSKYKVAYESSDARVIIAYEGLFVLADKAPDGVWELSGVPAQGKEKDVLKRLLEPTMDRDIQSFEIDDKDF